MKRTCPDREKLLLHAEGELNGRDRDEVASHVADCEVCAETVSNLRALASELRRAGYDSVRGSGGLLSRMSPAALTGSSPSDTCPDGVAIIGYVDGTLEGERAGEVERHIVSCRTCLSLVADLWAMSRAGGHDAPDRAVARVLARLESDSRTAVLRWAERSVELVRDFASSWAAGGISTLVAEPALATSRSIA